MRVALREAHRRTWKKLAKERINDTRPRIPLGRTFWPITKAERSATESVFTVSSIARLVTMVESRPSDARVTIMDSAYWKKGCSSLGLLRYGVLADASDKSSKSSDSCLVDIKEAVTPPAPVAPGAEMPLDNALRVVQGALHISPFLGERMRAATLLGRPVFIRELLPQDLKLEIDQMTSDEALMAAEYLSTVVGFAHARQMDSSTRTSC